MRPFIFFFGLIKPCSPPFFIMFPGRRLLCTLLALSGVAIADSHSHFPYVAGFVVVNWHSTFNNRKPPKFPVVPGKVFDRFVSIWLENTNFADAVADRESTSLPLHLIASTPSLSKPCSSRQARHLTGQLLFNHTSFGAQLCGCCWRR